MQEDFVISDFCIFFFFVYNDVGVDNYQLQDNLKWDKIYLKYVKS